MLSLFLQSGKKSMADQSAQSARSKPVDTEVGWGVLGGWLVLNEWAGGLLMYDVLLYACEWVSWKETAGHQPLGVAATPWNGSLQPLILAGWVGALWSFLMTHALFNGRTLTTS